MIPYRLKVLRGIYRKGWSKKWLASELEINVQTLRKRFREDSFTKLERYYLNDLLNIKEEEN